MLTITNYQANPTGKSSDHLPYRPKPSADDLQRVHTKLADIMSDYQVLCKKHNIPFNFTLWSNLDISEEMTDDQIQQLTVDNFDYLKNIL